jgi:hypothetical protein
MGDLHIPIPPSRSTLPGRKRNPDTLSGRIRALKVGESLWDESHSRLAAIAHAQIVNGRVDPGFAYVTRKEGAGARIWRTA